MTDTVQHSWWLFRASSEETEILPSWDDRVDTLVLRGKTIDRIVQTSNVLTMVDIGGTKEEERDMIESLWALAQQSQRYSGDELARVFTLTIIAGVIKMMRAQDYERYDSGSSAYFEHIGIKIIGGNIAATGLDHTI
jgi:hypothetical protein